MSKRRYKVLAADDEYWSRENIRTLLPWDTYSIDFLEPAEDGEEVLERIPVLEEKGNDFIVSSFVEDNEQSMILTGKLYQAKKQTEISVKRNVEFIEPGTIYIALRVTLIRPAKHPIISIRSDIARYNKVTDIAGEYQCLKSILIL